MRTKQQSDQPLASRVFAYLRKHCPLDADSVLLVAVSGGADSVCLLDIMNRLAAELKVSLHIAHLDHQLRGEESAAEARYVSALATRLGIPVTVAQRDVTAYHQEKRLSLEEAAREVRYAFFEETARRVGAAAVAVGHTRDDHIETALLHLIRGSGTRGLRGLAPQVELSGSRLRVIRPLLCLSRAETMSYCREHNLEPCSDSSNLSLSPLRNRVRLKLLPQLQGYNPQIKAALERTAEIAAADIDFIEAAGRAAWPQVAEEHENIIILNKSSLRELPCALKRQVLRLAIARLAGSLRDIEARHIEAVMAALDKPVGRKLNLPGGLIFLIDYQRYLIGSDPAVLIPYPELAGESPLKVPGETRIPGWRITARLTPKDEASLTENNGFRAIFDAASIGERLVVRSRRPGDRFQPLGMTHDKKINRFMIDEKIPRLWRPRIPVVSAGGRIIWLVGWRIDERAKVTGETPTLLSLEFRPD